jgi:hypothetical protein
VQEDRGRWFVKHTPGIVIVILVYLIILYIYLVALQNLPYPSRPLPATLHLLCFTALTALTLWSHLTCLLTNPGTLPRPYPRLDLDKLTVRFTRMLDERVEQATKPVVRKLRRNGEEGKAEQVEKAKEEGSVYRMVKEVAVPKRRPTSVVTTEAQRNDEGYRREFHLINNSEMQVQETRDESQSMVDALFREHQVELLEQAA